MANSSTLPLQTQLDRMMAADKASLKAMGRMARAQAMQALEDQAMKDGAGSPAAMRVLALAGLVRNGAR